MTATATRARRARRARRALSMLSTVLVVIVAAVALVSVGIPRVLGWMPLTIASGSMEPTYPVGSVVAVQPLEGPEGIGSVRVGDVVTFLPYPDDPTAVTHRVVSIAATTDGPILTTQGDALAQPDSWEITETQLRGVVRYHVPYVGYASQLVRADVGAAIAIGGLSLYAAWQVIAGIVEHRRARRSAPDEGSGEGAAQAAA